MAFLKGIVSGILSIGKFFVSILKVALAIATLFGQFAKDPMGTMLKIIMLLLGMLLAVVMMIWYFVSSIPPFIYIYFSLYFAIVQVVPFVLYSIVFSLLLAFITILCVILTIINVLTNGAIKNITFCQNSPNAWWAMNNYQLNNKYERELFCQTPCLGNFSPDEITGLQCIGNNVLQPAYCPQAEIYRIANGYNSDINYMYGDYITTGNVKYASQLPAQREETLKNYYLTRKTFLDTCSKQMVEYDYVCQGICANLDVLANTQTAANIAKLKKLCSQVYCGGNSSYPFCSSLTNSQTLTTSSTIKKITTIITLVILFVLLLFLILKQMNKV